jgi:hypothetical protein
VINMDTSIVSFSSCASDDHESLGVDHDQAPETQTSFLDAGSSSAMPPRREGVCFKRHVCTVQGSTLLHRSPITL